jgi:uncharacterized protein with PIN domain
MSRIQKAYEAQFLTLLRRAGARRPEQGVQWLLARADNLSASARLPITEALTRTHHTLADRLARRPAVNTAAEPRRFFCDAGLGGLARWLRAAGYEADWEDGIADDALLRAARLGAATLLTTDSMLMERRLLRDGVVPALWLPPTLSLAAQLERVFREFGLSVRAPRCMACGGELRPEQKEALRERIPPRTYRWLDEFFVCGRCHRLFWHGTHWFKIQRRLAEVAGRA